MRGRFEGFAAVRHRSEYPLNKRNPGYGLSCMFAVVRAGCRQTVVNRPHGRRSAFAQGTPSMRRSAPYQGVHTKNVGHPPGASLPYPVTRAVATSVAVSASWAASHASLAVVVAISVASRSPRPTPARSCGSCTPRRRTRSPRRARPCAGCSPCAVRFSSTSRRSPRDSPAA
jgi:hypothetical protein